MDQPSTWEIPVPEFDYEAVVVGSGFGGSVSAYHLAKRWHERVCVLERGKRYPPGSFPRTPYDMSRSFWDPSEGHYGLYNVWSFQEFGALVCSGLGGGSLIYANVLYRKPPETFDPAEGWLVDRATLEPHYDAVERMLGGTRYPIDEPPYRKTFKTHAMEQARDGVRARLGIPGVEWEPPPLAVAFGKPPRPGVPVVDEHPSVHDEPHPRLTCVLSGECDLGCNTGSKNTLDLNYLGHAKKAEGAEIRPDCEVTWIRPLNPGYEVTFVDHGKLAEDGEKRPKDFPPTTVTTKRLILAAGALGSTYLLLKCKDQFPRLGAGLGTRFSGNGDLLTFLVKARPLPDGTRRHPLEASWGPVITSAIVVPPGQGRRGHWIEDGGYPYMVSWLVEATDLKRVRRVIFSFYLKRRLGGLLGRPLDSDVGAELADVFGDVSLSASSMPMLAMGRDIPGGRLSVENGRLRNSWSPKASKAYFAEVERTARAIAETLGGKFRDSRIRRVTKVVTVHPLGGCPMAKHKDAGVVDENGKVHGYPGLLIADGSVMPGPVGPNPSLTIAALADRFARNLVS